MAAITTARMSGIDVSHFQEQIDWKQIKQTGVTFAFIKSTEGVGVKDPLFRQNWRDSRKAGVLRGAYHFFRPQLDPVAQAKQFLDTLGRDPGELPPALDIEEGTSLTSGQVIAAAKKWMRIVEDFVKAKPILYTGTGFWRNRLKDDRAFADNPLWIAHYTSSPQPSLPSAWPQWTFWQFSDRGKLAGISGDVDLDVFNGSADDLEELCAHRMAAL